MHPLAGIRICLPILCAACLKMARILLSCLLQQIRMFLLKLCSRVLKTSLVVQVPRVIRNCRCHRISTRQSVLIRAVSNSVTRQRLMDYWQKSIQHQPQKLSRHRRSMVKSLCAQRGPSCRRLMAPPLLVMSAKRMRRSPGKRWKPQSAVSVHGIVLKRRYAQRPLKKQPMRLKRNAACFCTFCKLKRERRLMMRLLNCVKRSIFVASMQQRRARFAVKAKYCRGRQVKTIVLFVVDAVYLFVSAHGIFRLRFS